MNDVVVDVSLPRELIEVLETNDPRINKMKEKLPAYIKNYNNGVINLDPDRTMYIPRGGMSTANMGSSYFNRILPVHLVEKALIKGTIESVQRRQRPIMHIKCGIEDKWEPLPEEMDTIANWFQLADLDPISGIVVTRNGVELSEIKCLDGKSLISTDRGLLQIKDFVKHDPTKIKEGTCFDTDIKVVGRTGNFEKVDKWWYQGIKERFDIALDNGQHLQATKNHKFVVFDGNNIDFKKVEDMSDNDYVLRIRNQNKRLDTLKLDLKVSVSERKTNSDFLIPTQMTPELAYLMALVISDGCLTTKSLLFANANQDIIDRMKICFKKVFNLSLKSSGWLDTSSSHIEKNGYSHNFKLPIKELVVHSSKLIQCFEQLGLKVSSRLRKDFPEVSPSYNKVVPWSIEQADTESQLAFLAGYIDGDGSYYCRKASEFVWRSTSVSILESIGNILMSFGYSPRVHGQEISLYSYEANNLKAMIDKYCVKSCTKESIGIRNNKGNVPGNYVEKFIRERLISGKNYKQNGIRGSLIRKDDGSSLFIPYGYSSIFGKEVQTNGGKNSEYRLWYSSKKYFAGYYDKQLDLLKTISENFYRQFKYLLENDIQFIKVQGIKSVGFDHVYDLTMEDEPIFAVQGVLCHNSGSDFWNWTEIFDFATSAKLKALGVNESILSGDASFSTLEAALSSFMDNISSTRDIISNEVFNKHLFKIIAQENGLYKDSSKVVLSNNANTRVVNPLYTTTGADIDNDKPLIIPDIQWEKQLKPKGDKEYLDMLQALSEMGVPVTMRMFAAAGGENIDDLVQAMEDDNELKLEIAEKKKDLIRDALGDGVERYLGMDNIEELLPTDMNDTEAKLKAFAKVNTGVIDGKRKCRNIESQDAIYGVRSLDKNGKRRVMTTDMKKNLDEKVNRQIASALSNINK
jgi:hypothetical protein